MDKNFFMLEYKDSKHCINLNEIHHIDNNFSDNPKDMETEVSYIYMNGYRTTKIHGDGGEIWTDYVQHDDCVYPVYKKEVLDTILSRIAINAPYNISYTKNCDECKRKQPIKQSGSCLHCIHNNEHIKPEFDNFLAKKNVLQQLCEEDE